METLTRLCNFLGSPASSICSWPFGLWPNLAVYFLRKGFLTPSLENKQRQEQISRGLRSQKVTQSSLRVKAAVLREIAKPLRIEEVELPPLERGQVLVEIHYTGLCHSQLNEIYGRKGEDRYLPHTLGHEGSGVVLGTGEGVTKVFAGDHVVISWIKGKGLDAQGPTYKSATGLVNSGPISTFLTHAIIAENRLTPIPKEISLREAALFGCMIPTGAGVIFNEMKICSGQSCAIFGMGGIGLSALIAARYAGAYPLIAVDVIEEKLHKSLECGATHVFNSRSPTFDQEWRELAPEGVDYALESSGNKRAMERAFSSVKAKGGLCILAGNLPKGEKIEIDPFDLIAGRRLQGTWGGASLIEEDIERYCALSVNRDLNFSQLISHEVKLEEINELIQLLIQGKVTRGIVSLHH